MPPDGGPPRGFRQKKDGILRRLAAPGAQYADASPKGSVDGRVRGLIAELNGGPGWVTTSSCSGRVSVFVEGEKGGEGAGPQREGPGHHRGDPGAGPAAEAAALPSPARPAGVGGKGGGGGWLFVSHDPLVLGESSVEDMLGLGGPGGLDQAATEGRHRLDRGDGALQLVHFKFEPMVSEPGQPWPLFWGDRVPGVDLPCAGVSVWPAQELRRSKRLQILHVLAASPEHAQLLLRCGLEAGFRESGAVNLTAKAGASATPMVAIRSTGLAFESLIGVHVNGRPEPTVSSEYLRSLVRVANERFAENDKRMGRFRDAVRRVLQAGSKMNDGDWEDPHVRRERKKAEGLRRREELASAPQDRSRETVAPHGAALDIFLTTDVTS